MYRLVFSVICLSIISGCSVTNKQSCELPENKNTPVCTDGGMVGASCKSNSDCTAMTATPACDTVQKRCVQCFGPENFGCNSSGNMPICTNDQCGGCTQHSDCKASAVCLSDGSCASETQVAYVDAAASDNPDCTQSAPCNKVMKALGKKRSYVKLHGNLDEAVNINDQNVTLLADPGTTLTRSQPGTTLQVTGISIVEIADLQISGSTGTNNTGISIPSGNNVTLSLKRVKISDNQSNGINCSGSSLTVSQSTISGNQGSGIGVSGGSLIISRSTISSNQGGGIFITGTPIVFDITNNFIYRNGNSTTATVGGASLIPLIGTSTSSRFEFNTVVDNQIGDSSVLAGGIFCDKSGFLASNNIIARNSVNNNATAGTANTAGQCQYPTSATASAVTSLRFRSPDSSPYDYHLQTGSSAIDQATTPSSINIDFDGDSRPANTSDEGADQHK